jgi:hypothetical protein
LYGSQLLDICLDMIEQKVTFYGLNAAGLELDGFKKHQVLLEAYLKVQKAKADDEH